MSADTPVPPSERDAVDSDTAANGRAVAASTEAPSSVAPKTRAAADPPLAAPATVSEDTPATSDGATYLAIAQSPDFETLRRTLRRFVFPVAAAFLIWYALYVLLSAFARDFMSTKVVGNINVALVFGLLQFVTTFAIAWWYARYADRRIDPLSAQLKASVENGADR
jgi:uncharacterized membrane protein (DUF485 family)